MMRRPCPADLVVTGAAVLLLGADIVLVRREKQLITDTLRTPAGTFGLIYLLLHVLDVLGPFDLFRAAGRRLSRA